jgi:hypothetical protein
MVERMKGQCPPGLFALHYETVMKLEFKDLELRNLDADTSTVGLSTQPAASGFAVRGAAASVLYRVRIAGTYSVRIADMRGKVVKTHSGMGPVAQARLSLGASGLFLAEIRSPGGIFTAKFLAD